MHYAFAIGIHKYDHAKETSIINALRKGWKINNVNTSERETKGVMYVTGREEMDRTLEADCAKATAISVWEANEGFCKVEVYLKPLDPPPPSHINFEKDAYLDMVVGNVGEDPEGHLEDYMDVVED